jgi:diguanylate cyclase (GGDEF)-like protein/PAS domain S-box-containing protein
MSSPPPATILIVDDEIQNRKLLETLLKPEGYLTVSVASGEDGLAEIARCAPDLILLDIMMPGMSGYEVATALKGSPATSSIPIIMLTALVDRAARLASLSAGVEEFLTKPVDRAELWLRVRNLLRLKAYNDLLADQGALLEAEVQARTAELSRFRAAMEISGDAIVLVDRASLRYIDVNQTMCDLVGRTRQELLGLTPMEIFSADRKTLERDYDAIIADAQSGAGKVEGHYVHRDGSPIPIKSRRRALRTDNGWIMVCTATDITGRKQAEEKIRRLNRVHAVLSSINSAIVRNRTRDDLFREVCRIAVSEGGFTLARIVELTPEGQARIAASSEADPRLFQMIVDEYNADPEGCQNLLASGLRSGQPLVSNDVALDTRMPSRRSLTADGSYALALLPIVVEQRVAGAVVLRAQEAGMFDEVELHLLLEVVSNIAFALDHIEKEAGVRRLTRVYAVLSAISTLIVRVRSRDDLFEESCRIAVEQGAFQMAWIGAVEEPGQRLKIAARHGGDQAYADLIPLGLADDGGASYGLAGRTVLGMKPVVIQDIEHDPRTLLREEAMLRGIRSMAVLPLMSAGKPAGVLALYANELGFFDEKEMKLLTQLAGNIAFAIDNLDKQDQLDYLAYYDVLTGLANRRLFLERAAQYMRGAAGGQHKLAVFLVDLERFKNINDSLGQLAGDALLRQVADWLTRNAGDANLVARVGADQFALVLPEVRRDGDVAKLVERTLAAFMEQPFRLEDAVLRLAAKVGVSLYPEDGTDADSLLKNAEAALKKAKASGNRFLLYTQTMTEKVAGKLTLENQLRGALDNGEFVLHYQPKIRLADGKVTSAEALIRWNDPRTGLVPPGRFIPVLEETGLIYEVGRWALRASVENYLRWRDAGLAAVRVAVNVSPMQLRNSGFIAEIKQIVGVRADAAAGLELEITESLIMEDVKRSIDSLTAIRAMGVRIAIDDFGTGFSSLSHLARLPVDTLKIDRSFVVDMTVGPDGLALVSTIINLAHSLKLNVVAEGVETEEQSRLLRLLNCDEMQGYLFSKPVPADVFERCFLAPPAAGDNGLATSPRFAKLPLTVATVP